GRTDGLFWVAVDLGERQRFLFPNWKTDHHCRARPDSRQINGAFLAAPETIQSRGSDRERKNNQCQTNRSPPGERWFRGLRIAFLRRTPWDRGGGRGR